MQGKGIRLFGRAGRAWGAPRARCRANGSALLVVLGILAILTMLVLAYSFSARTERIAARQSRDAQVARRHIDTVVALILSRELPLHLLGTQQNGNNLSLSRFTR